MLCILHYISLRKGAGAEAKELEPHNFACQEPEPDPEPHRNYADPRNAGSINAWKVRKWQQKILAVNKKSRLFNQLATQNGIWKFYLKNTFKFRS
jgi:hypothetical protein